mgnify:CR=1 FL=1
MCRNFNSIKVRLEHVSEGRFANPVLFQFHKGTIRTGIPIVSSGSISEFQFHKGTIRTKNGFQFDVRNGISIP